MNERLQGRTLTLEEKRTLYRDGYVILKQAVSSDLVHSALDRIKSAKKGENLGGFDAVPQK